MSLETESKTKSQEDLKKEKKRRRNRYVLWGVLLLIFLLLSCCSVKSCNKTKEVPQETVNVSEVESKINNENQEPFYELKEVTPVAMPISEMNGYVSNVTDFKRIMENNIAEARISKSKEIFIPSISLFFKKGSPYVNVENRNLIIEFANYYNQTNKKATILIEGYACDLGSVKLNNNMSKMRAEKVSLLFSSHIDLINLLDYKWYGEAKVRDKLFETREEYRRVNVSIK